MKRALRVVIEIMAPPLFAAVLLGIPAVAFERGKVLPLIGVLLLGAYTFGAVPSVVYALCMEFAFTAGVDPKTGKAVLLSGVLGLLAGMAMVPLASGGDLIRIKPGALAVLPPVGLLVGVLVSALVRSIEKRHENRTA